MIFFLPQHRLDHAKQTTYFSFRRFVLHLDLILVGCLQCGSSGPSASPVRLFRWKNGTYAAVKEEHMRYTQRKGAKCMEGESESTEQGQQAQSAQTDLRLIFFAIGQFCASTTCIFNGSFGRYIKLIRMTL